MSAENFPLVAVDVGNSRIKLGLFDAAAADASQTGLPVPTSTIALGPESSGLDAVAYSFFGIRPAWNASWPARHACFIA